MLATYLSPLMIPTKIKTTSKVTKKTEIQIMFLYIHGQNIYHKVQFPMPKQGQVQPEEELETL